MGSSIIIFNALDLNQHINACLCRLVVGKERGVGVVRADLLEE